MSEEAGGQAPTAAADALLIRPGRRMGRARQPQRGPANGANEGRTGRGESSPTRAGGGDGNGNGWGNTSVEPAGNMGRVSAGATSTLRSTNPFTDDFDETSRVPLMESAGDSPVMSTRSFTANEMRDENEQAYESEQENEEEISRANGLGSRIRTWFGGFVRGGTSVSSISRGTQDEQDEQQQDSNEASYAQLHDSDDAHDDIYSPLPPFVPKRPWWQCGGACRCTPLRAGICTILVAFMIYITLLGFHAWTAWRECTGPDGCYTIESIFLADPCGNITSDARISMGLDADIYFDVSIGGELLQAYVDKIKFTVVDKSKMLENGHPEVVRSSEMTPVFFDENGGPGIEKRVLLGHSKMKLLNSELKFERDGGAKRVAEAAWRSVNLLAGLELGIHITAEVWTKALLFPISKTIQADVTYRCTNQTSGAVCTFYYDGQEENPPYQAVDDPNFQIEIQDMTFNKVSDVTRAIDLDTTVQVTVGDRLPAIVTSLPAIPMIDLYGSTDPVYPSLDTLERSVPVVLHSSTADVSAKRAFNMSLKAHIEPALHSNGQSALEALQMMAQRYLDKSGNESFYMYAKPKSAGGQCFANQVLDALQPLRVEMTSIFYESKAPLCQSDTNGNSPTLKSVQLERINSAQGSGPGSAPTVGIVTNTAKVSLPFTLRGVVPPLEMNVGLQGQDLVRVSFLDKEPQTSVGKRRTILPFAIEITIVQPHAFYNVFAQAPSFGSINATIHGSRDKHVSLLSEILQQVRYGLQAGQRVEGAASTEAGSTFSSTVAVLSDTGAISLSGNATVSNAPFQVTLNECFTQSGAIVIAASRYQDELKAELDIGDFAFGPGLQNHSTVRIDWKTGDVAALALRKFLDDFRRDRPTPVTALKGDCVDVRIDSLPDMTASQTNGGPTPMHITTTLDSLVTERKGDGKAFNLMCALSGDNCPGGAEQSQGSSMSLFSKLGIGSGRNERHGQTQPMLVCTRFPPIRVLVVQEQGSLSMSIPPPKLLQVSASGELNYDSSFNATLSSGPALRRIIDADKLNITGPANLLSAAIAQIAGYQYDNNHYRFDSRIKQQADPVGPWLADSAGIIVETTAGNAFINVSGAKGAGDDSETMVARIPFFSLEASGDKGPFATLEGPAAGLAFSDLGVACDSNSWLAASCSAEKQLANAQQLISAAIEGDTGLFRNIGLQSSKNSNVHISLELDFSSSSSSTTSSSLASSWSKFFWSSSLNQVQLQMVGGRDQRGKSIRQLNIPCIIPELCPQKVTDLNGSPYTSEYELLAQVDLKNLVENGYVKNFVRFVFPELSTVAHTYVRTEFAEAELERIDVSIPLQGGSKSGALFSIPFKVKATNLQVLADVTNDVLGSVHPVDFQGVIVDKSNTVLPRLFETSKLKTTVMPTSPDGRPIPIPKSMQWWFPLKSVGAWSLINATEDRLAFSVNMLLKNPAPVAVFVNGMAGEVFFTTNSNDEYHHLQLGSFVMAGGGNMTLPGGETTTIVSSLEMAGTIKDKDLSHCSPWSTAEPSLAMNCAFSTLIEQLVSQAESRFLVIGTFLNPHGETISASFGAVLNQGRTNARVQPFKPAPRYDLDLPSAARVSAVDEFISIFDTVLVKGWSTAWQSLISQGVVLEIQVSLRNPFTFPVEVDDYRMSFKYDDPTGEYLGYLPKSFAPKLGVEVVSNLQSKPFELHIPSGGKGLTPEQSVHLLEHKEEHACRLYNAAEKVLGLCGNIPSGTVRVGVGKFKWRQHVSLYNVTMVGHNACLVKPWCAPSHKRLLDGAKRVQWSLVGSAKSAPANSSVIVLTNGQDYAERGAAWLPSRVTVREGFEAVFNFTLRDTATLGGGDGFAFVVQKDAGNKALGQRCENTPCNGYEGIRGTSFAIILYRSTTMHIELHGINSGDSTKRLGFATSPKLNKVNDDKPHTMRVVYSRNDRKIYAYVDNEWLLDLNVWEKADTDTGQCSAGNDAPNKDACVDLDTITDDDGKAWVGFTASTGYTYTSRQTVSGFQLRGVELDVPSSFLLEQGRVVGTVATPANFSIDVRDSCGNPIRKLVSPIAFVTLQLQGESPPSLPIVADMVSELNAGIIRGSFVPPKPGTYTVSLHKTTAKEALGEHVGSFSIIDL